MINILTLDTPTLKLKIISIILLTDWHEVILQTASTAKNKKAFAFYKKRVKVKMIIAVVWVFLRF